MQAILIASNLTKLGSNMMQKKVQMMLALLEVKLFALGGEGVYVDRFGL